jgi:hypothetical protein
LSRGKKHARDLSIRKLRQPNKVTFMCASPLSNRWFELAKTHLKFVASQPCLVCGRSPADAHHLRFAQPRAMGRKVSDEFTVPLCRTHHRTTIALATSRPGGIDRTLIPLRRRESSGSRPAASNEAAKIGSRAKKRHAPQTEISKIESTARPAHSATGPSGVCPAPLL